MDGEDRRVERASGGVGVDESWMPVLDAGRLQMTEGFIRKAPACCSTVAIVKYAILRQYCTEVAKVLFQCYFCIIDAILLQYCTCSTLRG